MARINNLNNFLTDIANALRTKTGTQNSIPAANFDTEILNIVTGMMSREDYITALELAENILGSEEYEDTMDILDDVDGVQSTYTSLGGTEDEIEEIFDEILGNNPNEGGGI